MDTETNEQMIFVELEDEGVLVWRPVRARRIEQDVYEILPQPYDQEVEKWKFLPGERVICEVILASGGPILAAIKRAG